LWFSSPLIQWSTLVNSVVTKKVNWLVTFELITHRIKHYSNYQINSKPNNNKVRNYKQSSNKKLTN
ncbi:MAG: hypothetical protein ORN24_00895, partial [Burkholderiales bacterium]|nr:hypothetical protein [Burkholderiales bacterium]